MRGPRSSSTPGGTGAEGTATAGQGSFKRTTLTVTCSSCGAPAATFHLDPYIVTCDTCGGRATVREWLDAESERRARIERNRRHLKRQQREMRAELGAKAGEAKVLPFRGLA